MNEEGQFSSFFDRRKMPWDNFIGWKMTWFIFACVAIGLLYLFAPIRLPGLDWIISFGSLLEKHVWLDILFLVGIILLLVQISLQRKFQNKYILVADILLLLFVLATPTTQFACWPNGISWKWILVIAILFGIRLASISYFSRKDNLNINTESDYYSGFIQKTSKDRLINCGWDNYIDTLKDKLSNTLIDEENIALGLVGNWGNGKTTFLEVLQENLKNEYIIVKFNAWQCSSPSDVILDFFNQLVASLGIDEFNKDIQKYLNAVGNFDKSGISNILKGLLSSNEPETIDDIKQRLNKHLKNSKKPVAVFIDDIDRMRGKEMLELLKLIRVSANLSNMVIISAYDKQYLVHQLQNSGFIDAEEYLKKIFNLEIALPIPETLNIAELICNEIRDYFADSEIYSKIQEEIFHQISIGYDTMISSFIKSFRDVKLFVNSLLFTVQLLKKVGLANEIHWDELFWVELLRIFDFKTYEILMSRPSALLDAQPYGIGGKILIFNTIEIDANNQNKEKSNLKKSLPQNTKYILERLFPMEKSSSVYSIQRVYNYQKYFNNSLTKSFLTVKEFSRLVNTINQEETLVMTREIIKNGHISTLYSQVNSLQIETCNESQRTILVNCLIILIEIANHTTFRTLPGTFKNFFDKTKCKVDMADIASQLFQDNLKNFGGNNHVWNRIFSALYPKTTYYEDDEFKSYSSIFDKEFIEKLSCENCLIFLQKNNFKIQDIPKNNTSLHIFVKEACVIEQEASQPDEQVYSWKSLIIPALKDYFANITNEEDFKAFLWYFTYDYEEEGMDMGTVIEENKERLFGSIEKFDEFKDACKGNNAEPQPLLLES